MLSEDMDDVLRDYYRWSQINSPDDIGYPHIDPVRRLLGGSVSSVGLSDEEAGFVDKALGYLKQSQPEQHAVIEHVYKKRHSLRWMEKNGMGDRKALARMASDGRQFLRGALMGASLVGYENNGATGVQDTAV